MDENYNPYSFFFIHPDYETKFKHILNPESIMEYFRFSQFYDKTSNNEVLSMQLQAMQVQQSLHDTINRLRMMVGIEYMLVHFNPPSLYVIRKQDRVNQDSAHHLASYYVLDGRIFQAPDLFSVMTSRISSCLKHISSAMDLCSKSAWFHPTMGHQWVNPEPNKVIPAEGDVNGNTEVAFNARDTQQFHNSLFQITDCIGFQTKGAEILTETEENKREAEIANLELEKYLQATYNPTPQNAEE